MWNKTKIYYPAYLGGDNLEEGNEAISPFAVFHFKWGALRLHTYSAGMILFGSDFVDNLSSRERRTISFNYTPQIDTYMHQWDGNLYLVKFKVVEMSLEQRKQFEDDVLRALKGEQIHS